MNKKFNDLLVLENYEGIYEGSIKEDGDNWKYHAEWYFNELAIIAENYKIEIKNEISDENIRKIRGDIKEFLINSLTIVDTKELSEEIAHEIKKPLVKEGEIDEACEYAWDEYKDDLFVKTYDKLKELNCKIETYLGEIIEE